MAPSEAAQAGLSNLFAGAVASLVTQSVIVPIDVVSQRLMVEGEPLNDVPTASAVNHWIEESPHIRLCRAPHRKIYGPAPINDELPATSLWCLCRCGLSVAVGQARACVYIIGNSKKAAPCLP